MIRKGLLLKIYGPASMQRWNDKIRPVELTELDKQAHKMIITYMLGKFEEDEREEFSWIKIIEGGLFEFLQRLVITDLKPQLFYRIKEDQEKYKQLNQWVYEQIEPAISPLGDGFCKKFKDYLFEQSENINRRILGAAHFYATKWEFDIIERANPNGYEIPQIKTRLQKKQEEYYDLRGIQQFALYPNLRNFVDLCGQLRFQVRWSHLHRYPRTSVLGHILIVAILSYLFSLEIKACKKRCINNYFSGLFHDLPEALTRDISHPVKRAVSGLDQLIKEYEVEEMGESVYRLIPKEWHSEIEMFTQGEFESIINIEGRRKAKSTEEISQSFNQDKYNPRDGEIIRAADDLAAFVEAYLALENGITSHDFQEAKRSLRNKYQDKIISGIKFGEIYKDFT